MGFKVNGVMGRDLLLSWNGECGIFVWCNLCCCVGITVFSFDGRCWWSDVDSRRWLWMRGSVVDRKEGVVGGCSSGGCFVGGVADWLKPVSLRTKV